MKTGVMLGVLAAVIVGLITLFSAAYTISETEQVIITQFGEPIGDPIKEAGLHWKKPFIQDIHRLEKRIIEYDGDATEIPTRDKKFIFIDTFARWRIVRPLDFYTSVRDLDLAKTRLDDIIDSETRDAISSYPLIEVVRNTDRTLLQDTELQEAMDAMEELPEGLKEEVLPGEEGEPERSRTEPELEDTSVEDVKIEKGRENITREILERAGEAVKNFGIELVDVQIKSINYVPRVRERVYERMISERQRIAETYRAKGNMRAAEIQGLIERKKNEILSKAYREAETIKGEAEATAARIYAEAYGQDPEFYEFWKSLQILTENISGNLSLVVSTRSDLFQYLRSSGAGSSAATPGR